MADENTEIQAEEMDELLAAAKERAADDATPGTTSAQQADAATATQAVEDDSGDVGTAGDAEKLLDQAEADLATAVDPDLDAPAADAAKPFELQSFDQQQQNTVETGKLLNSLDDVELDVRIELGRTELLIEDVMKLREGSVVPLDKLAGDPVDVLVNGRLVARGEVLVLNDNFCVRVSEILDPDF